jgi:hypothetical protein
MAAQTTAQLVAYYANLLIYQYISQPKAYATVSADVLPVLMPQGFTSPAEPILPLALQDAFTLGTAVGVQLDTLAEYIGAVRTNLQLNGLLLTMTDVQFTDYLTVVAARNNLGSDMGSIESFFNQYFPGEFSVYDFETMNMSFVYYEALGADPVAEAFIMAGYLPVPMAVGATFIFNPNNYLFFAYRTYNAVAQPKTTGFNFYSGSQVGKFSSYVDAIVVPFS